MGNWRTVNIIGTFDPSEVDAARRYLAADHESWMAGRVGPLSISDGLCSLGEWPATTVMTAGNLYERNYSVQDVADHLTSLVVVAPSARLKVHCGDDYGSHTCIATITVTDDLVTVGDPEVPTVAPVPDDAATGRLFKAVGWWSSDHR
jgi:hypothetical protein